MKIVEARDASAEERAVREINSGIYCVKASFLFSALERLQPINAQGEYYLTDIIAQAVAAGLPTQAVLTDNPHEVEGINSREELAVMEKTRQAQLRSHWMSMGVTLEDPDTVYFDEDVTSRTRHCHRPEHAPQREDHDWCSTAGSTEAPISRTAQSVTTCNSIFLLYFVTASWRNHTSVGPFAHLRGGTMLAPRVEIGNFVEVKKSLIGEHTKAKHLAYLGDTEMGRDSNIGAGTITCNYDGFTKQKTKIGDRVQVGSDTTLVAPITISDDVYIATATTVRKDVPAGALVFNTREEQMREGWTAAKRAKEAAKKAQLVIS